MSYRAAQMVAVSPTLPAPGLSAKRSKPELRSSPSSGSIALPDSTDSDDDAVDDDAKPSRITPQMLVGGALVGVLFIIVAVGVSSAHSQPRIAPLSPLAQLPLKVLSHPRIRAYSARIRSLWQPSATSAAQSDGAPHPILPLLLGARASWATLVSAQPRSLAQARKAYADRYAPLRPPPGFDQWYHFARARNFTLIDAFDGLMEDLAHYRGLGGNELRRRTKELASVSGVSLLTVKAGSVEIKTKSGRWAPAMAVKEMIEAVETGYNYELDAAPEGSAMRKIFEQWELPDFEMAINERAEGRVLPKLARELPRKLAAAVHDDPERHPSLEGFRPEWGIEGNVWDAYRRACPADCSARRLVDTVRAVEAATGAVAAGGGQSTDQQVLGIKSRRRETHANGTAPVPLAREMTFLHDLESAYSFCDRPSSHHLHSTFFTDSRAIEHLYPLFSGAKPQGFADILVPTHHHWNPTTEFTYEWDLKHGRTQMPSDPHWDDKLPTLFWRGKVTRGADTPPGHMSSFQKQRLVKMISDEEVSEEELQKIKAGEADPSRHGDVERVIVTLNVSTALLESVAAPAKVVDPLLFDIAMACDPAMGECAYLNSLGYHVEPPAPLSAAWKHKIVLDLDEAGFSPRFGALMESRSAVVKMSVQQEFWRDWVVPWYHFLPLSSSYTELHNLVAFFVGIPRQLATAARAIQRPVLPSFASDLDGFNADRELKRVADAGREWKKRHMRKADMEVYMFRLIIEWAALLAEPEALPS